MISGIRHEDGIIASQPERSPVPATNGRWTSLDALRGVAILAIALANAPLYLGPTDHAFRTPLGPASLGELGAQWILRAFASLHVYLIFALLFGFGLGRQLDHESLGGVVYVRRRLAVLFSLGIAHAMVLWFGDILATFAGAGVLLLILRRLTRRTQWQLAFVLLLTPPLSILSMPHLAAAPIPLSAHLHERNAQIVAYRSRDIERIVVQRVADLEQQAWSNLLALPSIVGMLLLGAEGARTNRMTQLAVAAQRHRWMIMSVAIGGLGIALGATVLASETALTRALALISVPVLAVATVAWLLGREHAGHALPGGKTFAAVGRGAISVYLLQSAIFTTIAYGYGGATYGSWSAGSMVLLALLIGAVSTVAARVWFKYRTLGPIEWLWRCAAHGSWRPLPTIRVTTVRSLRNK